MAKAEPLFVTLAELRDMDPCPAGYRKLMAGIEFDASVGPENVKIPVALVLDVNGARDAWWLLWHAVSAPDAVRPSGVSAQTIKRIDAALRRLHDMDKGCQRLNFRYADDSELKPLIREVLPKLLRRDEEG